jgi:hypothetical protein
VGFKKERLGPRLAAAARSGERYRDAHMFLGGTGAVGGTAVLQMLSLYEEMFSIRPPEPDDVPVLVATGTTFDEIAAFTRRLFRLVEARHGRDRLPQRVRSGYLTHSGLFVAPERFEVSALPALKRVTQTPPEDRSAAVGAFLQEIGTGVDAEPDVILKALAEAVAESRPFTSFLERYRTENLVRLGVERYRSVVVGIPIPSLIAYQQGELSALADHVPGFGTVRVEELKERFVEALRDDLVEVKATLADDVLIAHTTGVGGMYDEDANDGHPTIRLGFAHAGRDRFLADKHRFAEDLGVRYARSGVKVLVTAAAIGVDEVRVRERIPLHRQIRQRLFDAPSEVFRGSKGAQPSRSRATQAAGRPLPASQVLRAFAPLTVPFEEPEAAPVRFDRGTAIVPSYAIRSGENGFFSVANAEALYRVMRVASAGELGLLLATVALLGDDRGAPWFRDDVCYYTETDNARHVLDFLAQPALRRSQLSGLDPMALQDLGSAKHQAELHTLSLLILLHRVRTLDVDAIDPYVDLARFDPRAFLVGHSRTLTFEDVAAWDYEELARDVQRLGGAESADDLLPLTPPRELELFPGRRQALRSVLDTVLGAVWTVPSLGSPVLFERDGVTLLRTGYYVAPLDVLVTDRRSVIGALQEGHRDSGNRSSFADYRDYHLAVGGFVDLRPHAVVSSARSDHEDLTGRVRTFHDEASLRSHLWSLEPYSFFSTCGLLAVWFRLRGLYAVLRDSMIELGTLQGFPWHMPRDDSGHILLVPGIVEAFRMVSEGLEKTTGTERLDGMWGYEPRPVPDRRDTIPGLPASPAREPAVDDA